MRSLRTFCLALCFAVLLLEPLTVLAQTEEGSSPAPTMEEEGTSPLATMLTALNVPARGGLCFFSSLMGGLVMVISGGTWYVDAAQMIEESCSGPWVITDRMLADGRESRRDSDDVM